MHEGFVSLATWLRPTVADVEALDPVEPLLESSPAPDDAVCDEDAIDIVLRDVRLFRAALSETLEREVRRLYEEIALDVLARELEVRDCDVASVVQRALARYGCAQPVRVRVHPAERDTVATCFETVADASLVRGDALIELHNGEIDARFGVRVARLLAPR